MKCPTCGSRVKKPKPKKVKKMDKKQQEQANFETWQEEHWHPMI